VSQADVRDAIDRARREIEAHLKKVPASINRGSHQTAVSYKKAVDTAKKLLARKNATYLALQAAVMELRKFAD
jgi:hypothetical protein